MKLSKLKELLNNIPQQMGDIDVLMASDPEGNSIHSLDEHGLGTYRQDGRYWEHVEPEDGKEEKPNCLVLWP